MKQNDPYESFKSGIQRDVNSGLINIGAAFSFFFFILFLVMCFWAMVMGKSGLAMETRIGLGIFLLIVVPCLFFKRTANFIIIAWFLLIFLLLSGVILFVLGWFTFHCFRIAFDPN